MWRAFAGLVRKEFLQVFRDPNMLRLIFAMPLIQLILFGYVTRTEVKRIALDVYDYERSSLSREFVNAMQAGDYFVPSRIDAPLVDLEDRFKAGTSEMALIIPGDFSERIQKGAGVTLSLVADGANSNAALVGLGYAAQIVRKFSKERTALHSPIEIRSTVLYNPDAESVYFMVPGIVVILLTMITAMLTSMAIVRERERGTLEQLLVTPISRVTLLMGKIAPFAILGLAEMAFVLTVGVLWFRVPFVGSPLLLLGLAVIYLFTSLGVGLFFSTVTTTQQQAMFFAWFFSIFAILTSGFFTPIANMPQWLQTLTYLNPMRYFLNIVRSIMMKGAGASELLFDIAAQSVYAVVIFTFSAVRFTKR
ncbi:MAG TPA: ABC transporter permease [Candidatus Deferrimicrobium sp.]|nr:ABC transporter permease [Candidatus Deferrimicrobium sp.]